MKRVIDRTFVLIETKITGYGVVGSFPATIDFLDETTSGCLGGTSSHSLTFILISNFSFKFIIEYKNI